MNEVPSSEPEPWLRGALAGIHPLVMPVFFSFAQVREDLHKHTAGLDDERIWQTTASNSLGFQLKHIAGSVDRITSYLLARPLDAGQLAFLREEARPSGSLTDLIQLIDGSLRSSEGHLKSLDPAEIYAPRTVGRRELPTTVIGLLVHLAEHTQRHLGQAITIAQLLRQTSR